MEKNVVASFFFFFFISLVFFYRFHKLFSYASEAFNSLLLSNRADKVAVGMREYGFWGYKAWDFERNTQRVDGNFHWFH